MEKYRSLEFTHQVSARMSSERWPRETHRPTYLDFPAGSFTQPRARNGVWSQREAPASLIAIEKAAKTGLQNYHLLSEAEWRPVPPVDPNAAVGAQARPTCGLSSPPGIRLRSSAPCSTRA
jgi:hypothetical protein